MRVVVESSNIGAKTRQHGQNLCLNLDISADLNRPAVTDSLADTINYADIVAKIAEIAAKEAYCSMMSACAAFADAILWCDARVLSVRATVSTCCTSGDPFLSAAGATVERKRVPSAKR
ncbi:dihydroneopterin aldolase [Bradyrhizobium sp. USDA 3650]